MKTLLRTASATTMLAISALAFADPIEVVVLEDGTTPASLGGFALTAFDDPAIPDGGCTTSTPSPIEGAVEFEHQDGTPLCMTVQDPAWWEWEHGNVFTTDINWVELVMPVNTRAFSLFVGANAFGRGWLEAIDGDGNTRREYFGSGTDIGFGNGVSPGFGVYTTGSCSTISRIIVEPFEWGTGEFAINQDPCAEVPEPAPLWLIGMGLLGLALAKRLKMTPVSADTAQA